MKLSLFMLGWFARSLWQAEKEYRQAVWEFEARMKATQALLRAHAGK